MVNDLIGIVGGSAAAASAKQPDDRRGASARRPAAQPKWQLAPQRTAAGNPERIIPMEDDDFKDF